MNDVSKVVSGGSRLWHDFLRWFRGKAAPTLEGDAKAFLVDAEKIGTGLRGAAPDAPGLIADVERSVADGAAVLASRGADLPAVEQLGADAVKLFHDAEKAYGDYCAAIALASTTAPVVFTTAGS